MTDKSQQFPEINRKDGQDDPVNNDLSRQSWQDMSEINRSSLSADSSAIASQKNLPALEIGDELSGLTPAQRLELARTVQSKVTQLIAREIVEDISTGGESEIYRETIAAMTDEERLSLSKELHSSAHEYNRLNGLAPGSDPNALLVDVRIDGRDNVNDIDVVRGNTSADEPERIRERIDLYSPERTGFSADYDQELSAVTEPYAKQFEAQIEWEISRGTRYSNPLAEYVFHDVARDMRRNLGLDRDKYSYQMERNLLERLVDQYGAFPLAYDKESARQPRALFPEDAHLARNEFRPSAAVQSEIDWYVEHTRDRVERGDSR